MNNAFIITQKKARFDDISIFLLRNGYNCEQVWEEMESNINTLRKLDVKWPLPSRNCQMLDSMTDQLFKKVKEMIVGKNFNNKQKFPDLFIIDDCLDSSVKLESEKFFACMQYASYYLYGKDAKCSVIFLIHEQRRDQVILHSENKYVWLKHGDLTHFEMIEDEIREAICEFNERTNPKTVLGWVMKNF